MKDKDPRWQRYAALAVFAAVAAACIVFRSRLGADLWPLDNSRVGPNLVASMIQAAVVLIVAALLYPPSRRALHRLLDRKLDRLHDAVDALHERHNDHVERLETIAERVEALHAKLDARPAAKVAPRRRTPPKA